SSGGRPGLGGTRHDRPRHHRGGDRAPRSRTAPTAFRRRRRHTGEMTDQSTSGPDEPSDETIELAHQLFDWAREGQAARVGAYVDAGAPADLADPAGNTLLMLAAYHGHAELVRELARRGADVDRLNDRGQ